MPDLEDQLRAAREVIAVLQRRLERELQNRDVDSTAAHRAITSLENTVDVRTRELEASEAHYRALFDHNPNSTFLLDELGIILQANAAATEAFGANGELVERPLVELFVGSARDAVEALLDAGEGEAHEIALGDGSIVDIGVAQVPDYGHTQLSVRDVSTRVALGRELQHARRLAAIGHLAAGVAHEINNPLAVLQLGLEELATQHPELARVPELLAHADRIARIVANLQTFAEPRPPEQTCVLVRELVTSARELAGRTLDGVEVRVSVEPVDLAVDVDRGQLEQVMTNILINAGRALRGAGTIDIAASGADQRARLQISDTGPGIPEPLLEQIFTPFVSAGERMGMGLGLAISWGLVQENQGRIRAFNRPAGGACFELELPRSEPAAAKPEQPASAPDRPTSLRILCVEDEESLRRSLLRLLQASGHEPVGVGTAEEGFERLAVDAFDLVISDVRLPGHDGEWLRKQVVEHYPALRERVLLMSGFFPETPHTTHFLQKPFSLAQLRSAIAAILEPAAMV